MSVTLDVLDHPTGDPRQDLALELRLMEEAVAGGPRLFFYTWTKPVLVLGYGQPESDADLIFCRAQGIPIHRRASGGTGVLHRNDLAVSLALPMTHPKAKSIQGLYDFMKTSVRKAFEDEGLPLTDPGPAPGRGRARSPLCFLDHSSETLLLDGKKCVGCSQARKKDAALVHATLLLNLDAALTSKVFRIPEAKILQAIVSIPLPAGRMAAFKAGVGEIIRESLRI